MNWLKLSEGALTRYGVANSPHRLLKLSQTPSSTGERDPLVAQARRVVSELEDLALRSPLGFFGVPTPDGVDSEVMRRADSLKPKLQRLIEESLGEDTAKVDELLALNDSLTSLLVHPQGALGSTIPPLTRKVSKDKGSGLTVNIPLYNGDFISPHGTPATSTPNGHIHESPSATGDSDEELVSTPRLDKGKQRAKEEPEKPTPVLRRPSLVLDEEAEFIEPEVHPEAGVSPTVDRSVLGNHLVFVSQLDVNLNILTGLAAGSKKKGRSSVKAQSSLAPRRWRESTRVKTCERRLDPPASRPKSTIEFVDVVCCSSLRLWSNVLPPGLSRMTHTHHRRRLMLPPPHYPRKLNRRNRRQDHT